MRALMLKSRNIEHTCHDASRKLFYVLKFMKVVLFLLYNLLQK